MKGLLCGFTLIAVATAQQIVFDAHVDEEPWAQKYGSQYDLSFSGPLSFSRLPYTRCLDNASATFDVAVLGMPFDTGVTYRPGARFGPFAIRSGSRRQGWQAGYTLTWQSNPYASGATFIDCGDVPVSPFDNTLALDQMETAYATLLNRPILADAAATIPGVHTGLMAKDKVDHPRIVTLGGDHTIVLPILRALYKVYGPVSVIHADAHVDTWTTFSGSDTNVSRINHGTYFSIAYEEGLITNTSVHIGIRNKIDGPEFIEHDQACGFELITADDLDELGTGGVIQLIRKRVGTGPVYLSFDIDTIDPGQAPATGTPEAGGWTMREAKTIIRGLAGLNFVGADLVEVAPAYDVAEITGIAAADLVHDFITLLVSEQPPKKRRKLQEDL